MDRSKQSRRFACDRCRIYKLRCERVSTEGNSCSRCIKFGIFCETTNVQGPEAKGRPGQRRAVHASFRERAMVNPQSPTAIQSGAVSAQCIALSPVETQASTALGFDTSNMSTMVDPCPSDIMLSDFDFLDMMESHGSPQSYDGITGSISTSELHPDSGEPLVDITHIENLPNRHKNTNSHRDLLELSARLTDDIYRLECPKDPSNLHPSPSFLETATQRALSQTNVLINILKRLAIEREGNDVGGCENDVSTLQDSESSSGRHDVLFASTLVTSYILIVRYWQRLFLHIKRLHVEGLEASAKSLPILPALLFGGIQATANLDIQFMVLLETCSSMIQLIEGFLGVSSSCVVGFTETAIEKKSLLHDPISISMRETLLSVEVLHNARSGGTPSLKEMMKCMQEQVLSRCWRLNSQSKLH